MPGWNGETAVLPARVARHAAVHPPRPKPLFMLMLPSPDVRLEARLLEAVAGWYEREYQRPMPSSHVVHEQTPLGYAMVVYPRPVTQW